MADQQKQNERKKFVQKPNREIRLRTSKDGKYVMVDIIETWFFSSRYFSKVAENAGKSKPEAANLEEDRGSPSMGE